MRKYNIFKNGRLIGFLKDTGKELEGWERNLSGEKWEKKDPDSIESELKPTELLSRWQELERMHFEREKRIPYHGEITFSRYQEVEGGGNKGWIWVQRGKKDPIDLVFSDSRIRGCVQTDRQGQKILVEEGYENLTPLSFFHNEDLSPPGLGISEPREEKVLTRDGVELATCVWLPLKGDGPFPTVLVRTPYGRNYRGGPFLHLVDRGYALVTQDVRGCFGSGGKWQPFVNEKEDGFDTLEWIGKQPWSDGKVGMIGNSYEAFVQWSAAALAPPQLKALVSRVTAGTPFVDLPRKGGAIMSGVLTWAFMVSEKEFDPGKAQREDWAELLKHRPVIDIPKKALGKDIPFMREWIEHSNYDEYWAGADWFKDRDNIEVPAFIISGWYDDDGMGTSQAWEVMREKDVPVKMILGPWQHSLNTTRSIHGVDFGDNAIRFDLEVQYLQWFDRFLKGRQNGIDREKPVEYYLVGANSWEKDGEWPPQGTDGLKLYLQSGGDLRPELPRESLPTSFVFEPENPTPHLIDMEENELNVPENYREVEKREDVITFTSPVFPEDVEIIGDVEVVLYLASDAPDTDWVARLTDVDPDGNSIRLVDGLIRARYRKSFAQPELLKKGKVEEYRINLGKVSNRFKEGHKLRLQVTSGAENLIFPNPNTGEDPGLATRFVKARQEIYHDPDFASYIILPVKN